MIQSPLRGHRENRKLDANATSVKAKFIFFAQSLGRVRIGKPTFSRTVSSPFYSLSRRIELNTSYQEVTLYRAFHCHLLIRMSSRLTTASLQPEGINHLKKFIKEIGSIMRTWSSIWVKLNRECREMTMTHSLNRLVIDFFVGNH